MEIQGSNLAKVWHEEVPALRPLVFLPHHLDQARRADQDVTQTYGKRDLSGTLNDLLTIIHFLVKVVEWSP